MLAVATAAAGTTFTLVALGRRRRPPPPVPGAWPRLGVLVPAHDEERSILTTVQSVLASDYPRDRLELLVVADNCTDATAELARDAGATVLERSDPRRGKGYALELGTQALLSQGVDGVVILDADCDLPGDGLRQFARELNAGSEVVQAARLPRREELTPSQAAATAGSWIENAVSAGRDRLGLTVPLRGSGMCLAARTLAAVPWQAYGLVEDAEYGTRLARAGVPVRFRCDVVVRCEVPADVKTLATQRARWRTTLFSGPWHALPARWLASKPLVLAQLTLTTGLTLLAAALGPHGITLMIWLAAILALTAAVYTPAARQAGGMRVVLPVTQVVCRLLLVTLAGAGRTPKTWVRTARRG